MMNLTRLRVQCLTIAICGSIALLTTSDAAPPTVAKKVEPSASHVSFKRDVQPIFRRHCYRCHGPQKSRGGVRLSSRKEAIGKINPKKPLIVAGHPEKSRLIQRLTDPGIGDVMPLDGNRLSPSEIATLRQWITDGANWPNEEAEDRHWAYVKPTRPELPEIKNKNWPVNAVDYFVLEQLEEVGLTPSEPAERARLIRRVSLALTGLPPSLKEVDAFIADKSADAYEKVVDRLLKSERYGERWAQHWLDLARYADSNGFQADQLRDSWAYRDWVIKALNRDLPFDQFVIEQLAGDLLPSATVDQKIATGFHRTVTCNVEAGVHPEANRVNQIFDRVATTGTVFLGTTLECAQCHDHKYDPFKQREFYRIFAYFNNTPLEVKGNGGVQFEFFGPTMELPLPPAQQAQRDELQAELAKIEAEQKRLQREQVKGLPEWESKVKAALASNPAKWSVPPVERFTSTGGEDFTLLEDKSVLLGGSVPGTAIYAMEIAGPLRDVIGIKIETLTHELLPGTGPGRGDAERANFVLSEVNVAVARGEKGETETVALTDAKADFSQKNWHVSEAIDGDRKTGWGIAPQFHKPHWATFRFSEPVTVADGEMLVVKLDQNLGRGRTIGRVRLSALAGSELTADLPQDVVTVLNKPASKRTAKEKTRLRAFYASSNPRLAKLKAEVQQLRKRIAQVQPPSTLVMVENDKPRITHLMKRGDYLNKGDKVVTGTPEVLHSLDPKLPKNRLGFAKWLVSKENPLLARVTVNRWWEQFFGRGIVTTPEDFGTQGEWPTHPQLLDWLAVELMENGWSMKKLHKTIVLSATFRQSARLTPALARRDPENRFLARGPRFRLSAETIRDNALTVSGLLSTKMYGEPIMPFQPNGIWKAVGRNQPTWKTATGEDRFRRGLYVVWKRGAPYASFINFDAPDRAACTVQRPRTNTPLQALTLLNDPAYAEMAMALAQRMMSESANATPESIARHGFRLCTSREPSANELRILLRTFDEERKKLNDEPQIVKQRLQNLLPRLRNDKLNETDLAAWFAVANVLLNLDETISQ